MNNLYRMFNTKRNVKDQHSLALASLNPCLEPLVKYMYILCQALIS